jgi:hypothetical protein
VQPERISVAGLGPAIHVFGKDRGWLKMWMPGTSPGKGLLEAKFGAKRSDELPFNFPRTALPLAGREG